MTVAELKEHFRAEEELARELEQYAGRWIAVRDHEVAAVADSLEELLPKVGDVTEEVEVFKVPAEANATYLL